MSEPNFVHTKVPMFKFDTEIRAFDADGAEHRFTPKCHVSYSVCWKSSSDYQCFSSRPVLLSSKRSSIYLKQDI